MGEIAIGIDLGTSNSCVAVRRGDSVDVLSNAYGENTTASVVFFEEDGSIRVGNSAKAGIIHDPVRTIASAKRLIGRYFFSQEVKKAKAICAYEIIDGENHGLLIQIGAEKFTLPEISAMVLREMKSIAETQLGQPIKKAVITVPAYFNDNQRQATKDAGRIAGLEVMRILNEPTAAALAYGFGKGLTQRVAVWDLGGGTFDISVLEIGDDVFEVLATCGDTFLGGDDFDDRLIDLLADEFSEKEGINLRNDPFSLEKLKVAAEGAKKALSIDDEVEISIPDLATGPEGQSYSIQRTLTSQEYGKLVNDLIQRSFKVCDEALQQAGMLARDLDGVILVGGPTRLPLIRTAVGEYFQQVPKVDVDPDEVVAMGAAIHAASLINPDHEAYLLDVTPLSLRIGVAGGLAETVIERNTPVPIEQTRTFTTFTDFQESVDIRVYQGEAHTAPDNELLGQFIFSGFEKARRGDVEIDVTFEINADGIVDVRARDRATGEEASTRITLSAGLSEGEIEKIIEAGRTDRVESAVPEADQISAAMAQMPLVEEPSLDEASVSAPPTIEQAPAQPAVAVAVDDDIALPPPGAVEFERDEDLDLEGLDEMDDAGLPAPEVEAVTEPVDEILEVDEIEEIAIEIESAEPVPLEPSVAETVGAPADSIPGLEHEIPIVVATDEDLLPEPEELIELDDIDDAELIDIETTTELTDEDLEPTDPTLCETEPGAAKDDLFETPGTDLSSADEES